MNRRDFLKSCPGGVKGMLDPMHAESEPSFLSLLLRIPCWSVPAHRDPSGFIAKRCRDTLLTSGRRFSMSHKVVMRVRGVRHTFDGSGGSSRSYVVNFTSSIRNSLGLKYDQILRMLDGMAA
jgi:hypothetical protein